jgi:hypothetical protein
MWEIESSSTVTVVTGRHQGRQSTTAPGPDKDSFERGPLASDVGLR